MKVATFNANSIRSRLETVVRWLQRQEPDVLCIQETKVQDRDFPAQALRDIGYQAAFRGEKAYNGVALLSRARPDVVAFGIDDGRPSDETRLVYARVGGLHIVNTYVPQGRALDHPMYRYKLDWLKRLKAYFGRHFTPRLKLVWVGDMNVAPEPMDIYNAEQQQNHVCFHADVRKAFADTVAWGFTDCFRRLHPEAGHYTFFDYRAPRSATWDGEWITSWPRARSPRNAQTAS
jgi:exodeoxyribonuclease-3